MSAFDELVTAHPLRISESILARTVDGDRITLAVFELDPGSVIAEHSHENEQLGMVIRGSLAFRVASEVRELGPGGTWRIPPNTPHEVHTGPEGAVVIDVFTPPRDDWQSIERGAARTPRWP